MGMSAERWSVITESEFDWEREALAFLRAHLPDVDPWHVWTNFEFIDDQGRVNEVDALVFSPRGLFLVEIKSRPGRVEGDTHSWTWVQEGRRVTHDNPFLLANRKAKRLKSLLQRQPVFQRAKGLAPYITALIFLAAPAIDIALPPAVAAPVFGRGRPGAGRDDGIVAALAGAVGPVRDRPPVSDPGFVRTVKRAIEEAGVRPSLHQRRIGDYELGRLIDEGADYQDFEGRHVAADVRRRIRIYHQGGNPRHQEVRKAVAREFQILEGINHPGILRASDFKDTDRGPALVFEFTPTAIRFDHLLRERAVVDRLDVDQRLHLVRQLAETIRFAHEKRLYHRALAPQNVLIRDPAERLPRLQVMNWQLAAREAGTTGGTLRHTLGTVHLEDRVDDQALVYLAPESLLDGGPPVLADVFSLGAIAYHIFTGQPPAASAVEMVETLRQGRGLMIAGRLDGAPLHLEDLVRSATHPEVSLRLDSVAEFLVKLGEVEAALSQQSEGRTVDPSAATAGDRLDGGFDVVRRLGRGSSADALLVHGPGRDEALVLKVAIDPAGNDRIRAEGEVLSRMNHQNIVRYRDTVMVAGRTALLMEPAGEETLSARLRRGERPSLDLGRRWGEDLLAAIDYLDEQGVAHRDIKPDNIGIRKSNSGRLHLVLFDFSLSKASLDSIHAGTRPYLDPFLALRRPPRWDLAAERFAVGVTLYEMMTGSLPVWGDGASEPAVLDVEATLEAERFDPQVREGMVAFFARACRRDPRERFDNAEEMLRAWRQVFDEARTSAAEADTFEALAREATARTPVADLGYGMEALDVLTRMGIESVRSLLAVPRIKFRHLAGVGDRVRREIREMAKRLATLRPDLVPGGLTCAGDEAPAAHGPSSIDRLADMLLPRRPVGEDSAVDGALACYLGLEETPEPWPGVGTVASRSGLSRAHASEALREARQRWQDKPALTEVRADIARMLDQEGGVVTAPEAARILLLRRGSYRGNEDERLRLSLAVVRAAVEGEEALAEPRFRWLSTATVPVIATDARAAAYAIALGEEADALASETPVPSPQRVRERLEAVPAPELETPPPVQRLIRLAVAVASRAALSSRQEIYPRGLAADQAVRLALSSLIGPPMLTRDQIVERVTSRYPEAAALPERPDLDTLLAAAGAELDWREAGVFGPGYYRRTLGFGPSGGTRSSARLGTVSPPVEESPDVLDARGFEERVARAVAERRFLALSVAPRRAPGAAAELERRFGLDRISIDALLIRAMKAAAATHDVEWLIVRATDAAGPTSAEWPHLCTLAGMAWAEVESLLRQAPKPLLLEDVGLIGRYGLIGRLDILRADCGTGRGPQGLVVLIPMLLPGMPAIDNRAVPVMTSQWALIPDAWLDNVHRAGQAA